MATLEQATDRAVEIAIRKAEKAIQKILCDLEHDTMLRVERAQIDVRPLALYAVDIGLRGFNR